jgi:hypothetical protein
MDMNNMFGSIADNSDHMQIPQFQIYPPMDRIQGEPNSSPLMTLVMRPQRCRRDASSCNDVPITNTYAEQDPVLFPQQIQMPAAPQGNGHHHNGYAQGQTMPVPQGNSQFSNDYQVRLQGINTAGDEHGKIEYNASTTLSQPLTLTGSLSPIMREMSRFSNTITQLFRNMNNRMTKAEYERDVELRRNLARDSNISFAVPQTAPALGGHVRFRDADDMHFDSPVTPTKPHTFIRESFSQEPEQSPLQDHGFSGKLTGKNKKKGEKTSARKSLQIKLPSGMGKAPASSPLGGLHTPITNHAVSTACLQAMIES